LFCPTIAPAAFWFRPTSDRVGNARPVSGHPGAAAGKLALYATGKNYDLLHTFSIFGDPALEMKIPASPVYLPIITRPGP